MIEFVHSLGTWLTEFNVQVLGVKPFHLNLVKTPLLMLFGGLLLWTVCMRSSEKPIFRFVQWCEGCSPYRCIVLISGLLVVGVFYLSVTQFYVFTAEAYDLGIYSNSLWHTIHGQWLFDSLKNEHLLGDHFGPILTVFAPLYYLWDSPIWLLLIQTVALGLGAVAAGLVAYRVTGNTASVLALLVLYVSNPYLHSVAALDFHPIALAIPIFLWMLYAIETDRPWLAGALAIVALTAEESLPRD